MQLPEPVGWRVVDSAESTQDLLSQPEFDGVDVVLAKQQTGGRGRHQRTWHSGEPGESLAMSIAFRALAGHPKPWLIGMGCAVAAASAVHAHLQWPNDLVLDGKKLGGILTEIVGGIPIVGIGLNLNQTQFPSEIAGIATSLTLHRPAQYDAETVARSILDRLARLPDLRVWSDLQPIWNLFDETKGKPYALVDGRKGTAIGIGPEGELLVSVEGETERVLAADGWSVGARV
ncbi:MAG: Bifunctional ligase/repressor BirA [Fimbriimonadaceae bacterium]|nr:Bifunctional ligase/repressor BirA [Fimbriimonadaceae bacterium]